jgi:hypothetical protein
VPSRTTYDPGYVASCRKLVDDQVARRARAVEGK